MYIGRAQAPANLTSSAGNSAQICTANQWEQTRQQLQGEINNTEESKAPEAMGTFRLHDEN